MRDEETALAAQDELKPVKKQGHNFMRARGQEAPDPAETADKLRQLIKLGTLPRVDTQDPEAVQDRIVEYFQRCIDDGVLASIGGLSLALGLERTTLFKIRRREFRKPQAVYELIDMACNIINAQYEETMQEGKINPLAGIFLMRNNFGYTNTDDTSIVSSTAPEKTPDEIKQKYDKLLRE